MSKNYSGTCVLVEQMFMTFVLIDFPSNNLGVLKIIH